MPNLGLKVRAWSYRLRLPLSGLRVLRTPFRKANINLRRERGISLIEVLAAVSILGFIGPAFLIGIDTLYKAVAIPDEQIQAEALARSQLDDILATDFNSDLGCYPNNCYPVTVETPTNYSISISARPLDDREGDTCTNQGNCNTLQEVTVSISRSSGGGDSTVLTVSVWKSKK